VLLLVAAGLLLVAGCGGTSQRQQVVNYLQQVDAAQNTLAGALHQVSVANEAFAKGGSLPTAGPQLVQAGQTLVRLRGQLAAIRAPEDAKHLRALLLELLDREIGLSQELRMLSIFLPRFDADLRPLVHADLALKDKLGKTASGTAASKALDAVKAEALASYAAQVAGVSARLRTLKPPAVWTPAYTSQLSELAQLDQSASLLGVAINGGDAAAVPALLRRFDGAAVADQSLADQRAQIAAVDAYDRKVRSLTTIGDAIEKERTRLQRITS
jgi:hypothetical protein